MTGADAAPTCVKLMYGPEDLLQALTTAVEVVSRPLLVVCRTGRVTGTNLSVSQGTPCTVDGAALLPATALAASDAVAGSLQRRWLPPLLQQQQHAHCQHKQQHQQ